MDNPEEGLSGPVAGDDGQTMPASPHGSVASRHSSTPRSSIRSSHSSPKAGLHQKTVFCRKQCSTVLACLLVGVLITLGSVAMTVCGYFAMNIAGETVQTENSTMMVLDEQLHDNLYKFRTFGPVMIGFGSFLIMCACVLLCEEKDKRNKTRTQASENLLSEHERIMQQARERFYNENRTVLMAESHTVDYRTPKVSTNELTSCLDSEMVGNSIQTGVKPLTSAAPENDNVSGTSNSPVVLVHGPTIVEPTQSETENRSQCNESEITLRNNSPLNSNHSSPDHKFDSPSRNFKKSNTVKPLGNEDVGSGQVFPTSPVLPKIDSARGSSGISRAGGAIPKSILVQPMKLSPIRSVNGPIRVRLDDSPTELSPTPPSSTSKSTECLPQPRSPGSTPLKVKRGKKKKTAGGLEAGAFGQCRCLSDPSMAYMPSPDRQLDSCCCLQPECCWEGNCQMDKSIPQSQTSSTSATKKSDDPLEALVATGGKTNLSVLQPLKKEIDLNAQSIELEPKSSDKRKTADHDKLGPDKQNSSLQDTPLIPQKSESMTTKDDKETVREAPPHQNTASPSRQVAEVNECSAIGGENVTTGETNTDTLVVRDRNSNITVSSMRQDAPGKSAPYGGQPQGGVMV